MPDNILASLGIPDQSSITKFTADDMQEVMKVGYLPRLQVCNSSSEICQTGKANIGAYALVTDKDNVIDIGKELDILVISVRPKALRLKNTASGNPMSYFNMQSPDFKRIQGDSAAPDSGCMYGPEFLVWVPSQSRIATFFLGSKSGRKAGGPILTAMKQPDGSLAPTAISLRSTMVKNTKGVWQVPVATVCSTPIQPMPDAEELTEEIQKFNNPPASAVESVDKAEGAEAERAR